MSLRLQEAKARRKTNSDHRRYHLEENVVIDTKSLAQKVEDGDGSERLEVENEPIAILCEVFQRLL